MTLLDKTIRDSKRVASNARSAASTAAEGGEMLRAATDVIAARMGIMARGIADPRRADLQEMSLMSTEKVEAISASAAAVAETLGEVGARMSKSALDEVGHAALAAAAMAGAKSPAGMATAHYNYAVGWWGRATGQMLTLNTELLKAQADAMKPIHSAAVANAQRLKR